MGQKNIFFNLINRNRDNTEIHRKPRGDRNLQRPSWGNSNISKNAEKGQSPDFAVRNPEVYPVSRVWQRSNRNCGGVGRRKLQVWSKKGEAREEKANPLLSHFRFSLFSFFTSPSSSVWSLWRWGPRQSAITLDYPKNGSWITKVCTTPWHT